MARLSTWLKRWSYHRELQEAWDSAPIGQDFHWLGVPSLWNQWGLKYFYRDGVRSFQLPSTRFALNRSRQLQLYELSNLEPYCQICGLEAVPLKLDYW